MARVGRFEFVGMGDPAAAAGFRAELKKWLAAEGVNGSTGQDVISSANEAFLNAARHPLYRAGKEVTVVGQIEGREIVIRVADQGRWNWSVDPMRGHYGFPLMEAQMDSVEVDHGHAGTVVTLRRSL